MSERGQHWQAIAISIGLHLLPLLLLVHWVAAPPLLPPPEQDVRISLRLLAPATPPSRSKSARPTPPARRSRRAHRNRRSRPSAKAHRRARGRGGRQRAGGPGRQALPVALPAAVTDASPAPASITAAPPAPDAPPADFQAGAASDQWEARLMARLERYRYYPAAARSRRQQGTAWVRASIDREAACRPCGWSSPAANRCSTTPHCRRSAARSRCRPFP
jgi:protein TonB